MRTQNDVARVCVPAGHVSWSSTATDATETRWVLDEIGDRFQGLLDSPPASLGAAAVNCRWVFGPRPSPAAFRTRSRLPTTELAFLSAWHTARMKDRSVADEALHLSSAVQYSRIRSMIETMQAIADMDGRDLAERFYTPAEALRDEEARVG
ncbi:hypothetical protein EDB84DRAFT_1570865 [Lactarius hengduanensis]|nr:hypothetical protein EDB84DRAFT_1570865 [Lactarius hengduanensis]